MNRQIESDPQALMKLRQSQQEENKASARDSNQPPDDSMLAAD